LTLIKLDASQIIDWDTFHNVFAETFGFPEFYGRNMNAWIDCMTWPDDSAYGMTSVRVAPGELLCLQIEGVDIFAQRCPEQYSALIECSAFVNWRRIEKGHPAILALSFYM
jgi:hypothetical protein